MFFFFLIRTEHFYNLRKRFRYMTVVIYIYIISISIHHHHVVFMFNFDLWFTILDKQRGMSKMMHILFHVQLFMLNSFNNCNGALPMVSFESLFSMCHFPHPIQLWVCVTSNDGSSTGEGLFACRQVGVARKGRVFSVAPADEEGLHSKLWTRCCLRPRHAVQNNGGSGARQCVV